MIDLVKNKKVIRTKTVFILTFIVLITISFIVFGVGPKNLYTDSLKVVAIISIILLLFLTLGLYNGVKFVNDMPDLIQRYKFSEFFEFFPQQIGHGDFDAGDGIMGLIISIIMWLIITIVVSVLLSLLFAVFWLVLIVIIMALYWLFYRALRIIFKKSIECKNNLAASLKYSLIYTLLFSSWFYLVIFLSHFYKQI